MALIDKVRYFHLISIASSYTQPPLPQESSLPPPLFLSFEASVDFAALGPTKAIMSTTHAELAELPEGIFSLLDTDLYKLTMQCAILKYLPDVRKCCCLLRRNSCLPYAEVTYAFTNRTPDMRLNRTAYHWIEKQIRSMCFECRMSCLNY